MNYKKDYKQILAENRKTILKVCPNASNSSGIYILTRYENDFKYCYVGQAVKVLSRLSSHLAGYQHIDLSIKSHGFFSKDNVNGWKIHIKPCPINELDEQEQINILKAHQAGFQLHNKTTGSQGTGKKVIAEIKPSKGYRQGIGQGYKNASKMVSNLFEKHLDYTMKKNTKNAVNAVEKLKIFLDYHKKNEDEDEQNNT